MKKRVLIITGAYAPAITADTHRARMLAWDLSKCGWNVEILAPGVGFQRHDAIDPDVNRFFNPDVPAQLVDPPPGRLLQLLNVRGIGWRAFRPMYRVGLKLLRGKRFDLIYITTTQFNFFCLGGLWKRKVGVPYVLDLHDPWVRDEVRHVTTRHRFKFRLTLFLSKFLENYAIKRAAGLVAVSPAYIDQLRKRYPEATALKPGHSEVIPFAALRRDIQETTFDSKKDQFRIVYVGAGGNIMEKSFRHIAETIKDVSKPDHSFLKGVRIDLVGTDGSWRTGQACFFAGIASEYGLSHTIFEEPARISYGAAMQTIMSADGLLILGVDDPAYMPSKLFTYALTGKPLLVCLHKNSQANQYFDRAGSLGHLIHFSGESKAEADEKEMRQFLQEVKDRRRFDRRECMAMHLSESAAKRHAKLFERVIRESSKGV